MRLNTLTIARMVASSPELLGTSLAATSNAHVSANINQEVKAKIGCIENRSMSETIGLKSVNKEINISSEQIR